MLSCMFLRACVSVCEFESKCTWDQECLTAEAMSVTGVAHGSRNPSFILTSVLAVLT